MIEHPLPLDAIEIEDIELDLKRRHPTAIVSWMWTYSGFIYTEEVQLDFEGPDRSCGYASGFWMVYGDLPKFVADKVAEAAALAQVDESEQDEPDRDDRYCYAPESYYDRDGAL